MDIEPISARVADAEGSGTAVTKVHPRTSQHLIHDDEMATPQTAHAPAFQKVLDEFRAALPEDDQDEFLHTTLEDLQRCILQIQSDQASSRKCRDMARLKRFLEAMEQCGKIVEVYLNCSNLIAFIWVRNKFCHMRILAYISYLGTHKVHVTSMLKHDHFINEHC